MGTDISKMQNPNFICPPEIFDRQALVPVKFYSFDGEIYDGEILIDKDLKEDIKDLFDLILKNKFPIQSAILASDPRFFWDDNLLMEANNTSAFNYRYIGGTSQLSQHAFGRAIDINPIQNPYVRDGITQPKGSVYDVEKPGTLTPDCFVVEFFKNRGWTWGGDWKEIKDYQHFEKKWNRNE